MPSSQNISTDNIILFDSQCNLCNGWSRFILKLDTRQHFTLCRAQSPAGQQLLKLVNQPLDNYQSMIYLERQAGQLTAHYRSDAALRIVAQLPGHWQKLTLLRYIPCALRDAIYNLIARNRYRLFGKPPQCRLPDASEQQRFLEKLPEQFSA
jgi:predicted DCC family thiol-disulfide oxidoreductase YuxK